MKTNHLIPLAFNKKDEISETVARTGNARNDDKEKRCKNRDKKIQSHITF
jgi:hypothetical protein